MTWPVIQLASSEQSSVTAFPISAGVPSRPIGVHSLCQARIVTCASFGRLFKTLSSIHPGLMATNLRIPGSALEQNAAFHPGLNPKIPDEFSATLPQPRNQLKDLARCQCDH